MLKEMPISFIPYTAVYGPLSLPGISCTLWLDGADTTQAILSGTNITRWNDKSGFGNSCSNISGGTSITYPGTTVNGLNTVNFTAGCIRGAFNGASSNTGTDVTIFIVTSETAPNDNLRIFSLTGASSYQDNLADQMLVYGAVGGYLVGYYRGGTYSTTYSVTQNVPFLYTVTMTSGIGSQWFNGGSNATGSVPVSAFGVTNYNIGTQYYANQNYTGLMCEVVVYKNLLGAPQRQAIEGYLAQKWGLTANLPPGHPGLTQTLYNGKVYQPRIALQNAPYANYFPLSIGGCSLWLDGADPAGNGVIPANGTSITSWVDKSLSGNTCTNSSSANSPVLYSNILNGKPVLSFTGPAVLNTTTSQWLDNTVMAFPNTKNTIFALVYNDNSTTKSFTANNYIISGRADALISYSSYSGNNFATFIGSGSGWNDLNTNTPSQNMNGVWAITGMTLNTNILTPYYNGVALNTKSGTMGSTTGFIIGEAPLGARGQCWNGYMAEIIMFPTVLGNTQRQQIEGYLAWKWGLQAYLIGHPYSSAPPLEYTRGSILPPPTLNAFGRLPYASQTPYYNVSQQTWLSVWQPYLKELVAANSGATASLSSTGASVTSTNTGAAIIAPNGNIYYSVVGSSISYYNPTTNAVNSIALGQAIDSPSAVLGADGNMYMYPTNANTGQNIIKITTSNNTASTIPAGTNGWWGMILAPNGNIYGIPARTMTNVLVLNTTTGTTSTITGTTNGYWGGVLAPNGKIYCIPGSSVAIIDPVAGTITPNAVSGGGQANGYFGGVLGWDGNIYCIPCSGTGTGNAVGIINPTTNTFTTISSTAAFYSGGCLGPDGKIYCIPRSGGAIGVINIATQSFSVSSMSLPTGATYNGATLAPSGIIYVSPYTSGSVIYKITFSGLSLSPYLNLCLTPYINKF